MVGVEIDFVTKDCMRALDLYKNIFDIELIEVTDLPQGQNEVVFTIYGVRLHMLDENLECGLEAPGKVGTNSMWFNITVPNIEKTYNRAMKAGCIELQPVTVITEMGLANAMFKDPFGYVWMLHEIHKAVNHEETIRMWKDNKI